MNINVEKTRQYYKEYKECRCTDCINFYKVFHKCILKFASIYYRLVLILQNLLNYVQYIIKKKIEYDYTGVIDFKSITPFCASSDENRSEKSQSCLHELGFLHGYSRSAATMTERSSGIKLRARAAMRIEA